MENKYFEFFSSIKEELKDAPVEIKKSFNEVVKYFSTGKCFVAVKGEDGSWKPVAGFPKGTGTKPLNEIEGYFDEKQANEWIKKQKKMGFNKEYKIVKS